MKKLSFLAIPLCAGFIASLSFAAPSSKFCANVKDLTIVPATDSVDYHTVLSSSIKTPNKKDLLVGVSFETGLYTRTLVRSKNGVSDSETATATLRVKVLVDGQQIAPEVAPKEVVYDHRLQTLSATLGGVIESCGDYNGDGIIVIGDECVVTDEIIELILDTMAAHHFNFVVKNLEAGDHLIEVQVEGRTSATSADASATVTVGRGSLTVEEVRATNLPDGITFEN